MSADARFLLVAATALVEIAGCLLAWRLFERKAPTWLLIPATIALSLGVWLLNSELVFPVAPSLL